MILDDFEPFEVDKLIKAMNLLVSSDSRDGDAKHVLQLLKDIKENNEVLTVVRRSEPCEVTGCNNPAEYEGWYRVRDFTGNTTGLIQRRRVCEEHTKLLIAKKKEN